MTTLLCIPSHFMLGVHDQLLQIAQILPSVTDKDLYIEPSLTQLAAMAREEPESLEYVSNFRVVHRRHGSVLWTESIDVRGLDLDNIVLFSPGAVDASLLVPLPFLSNAAASCRLDLTLLLGA